MKLLTSGPLGEELLASGKRHPPCGWDFGYIRCLSKSVNIKWIMGVTEEGTNMENRKGRIKCVEL